MPWVVVPGSNGVWEYENTATALDTYVDANGTTTAGIRTFALPNSATIQQTYIKTRKAGELIERGELSKTYYDRGGNEIPVIDNNSFLREENGNITILSLSNTWQPSTTRDESGSIIIGSV